MNVDTPDHLANAVASGIERDGRSVPLHALQDLFQLMYYASLRTEERQSLRLAISYLDPEHPDPNPPEFPPKDRWSCTRLRSPVAWDMATLVKLSQATDPRGSSLALYLVEGSLQVWGIIDQQNRYHDFVNQDTDRGPERPGLFQAHIEGPGQISVSVDYARLAELRIDTLVPRSLDVLGGGPVRRALTAGIDAHVGEVRARLAEDEYSLDDEGQDLLARHWIGALSRVLLRVQNYRHGGAVLITPLADDRVLRIKYRLPYTRLRQALTNRGVAAVASAIVDDEIVNEFMEPDREEMPVFLHVESSIQQSDLDEAASEVGGATRFVSLLTRVDGVVLLSPRLEVMGFGTEITADRPPRSLRISATRDARPRDLRPGDYEHYGTRHRSMMRYCAADRRAVGFVVSQDGDVRALASVRDDVVMWERVRLQVEQDRSRSARRERSEVEAHLGRQKDPASPPAARDKP